MEVDPESWGSRSTNQSKNVINRHEREGIYLTTGSPAWAQSTLDLAGDLLVGGCL